MQKTRLQLSEAVSLWDGSLLPDLLSAAQADPLLPEISDNQEVYGAGVRLCRGMVLHWREELGSSRVIYDRGLLGTKVLMSTSVQQGDYLYEARGHLPMANGRYNGQGGCKERSKVEGRGIL